MAGAHVKVTSSGVQQVAREFDQVDKSLGRVGRTGSKVSSVLTRDLGSLGSKVSGVTRALAGLGAAAKAKDILEFDNRLGVLQAKMRASTPEMQAMKDGVLGLGSAYGVQKDKILGAIETYQDYGGLVRQGLPMLKLQTKLASAYGAEMADLAKIDAVLIKQGLSVEDRAAALAKLTAQADAGTVSLEGLAAVFPEIAGVGGAQGFLGLRGVDQLGTALQVAGDAFAGSAEQSRTAVRALLRDLTMNAKKLRSGLGIKVFDKKNNMRDLDTLMAEIVKKTGGKMAGRKGLAKFFTADSQALAAQWAAGMRSGMVGGVMGASTTASEKGIDEAVEKRMTGIAATAVKTQQGLAKLDEAAQKHGSTLLNFLAEDPKKTALVAGGGYAALKVLPAVARFLSTRGSKVGGGVGSLGGLGVQHVWVDNLGAGGLGAPGAGVPGAGGKIGGIGDKVGAVGSVGTALAVGAAIGAMTDDWDTQNAKYYRSSRVGLTGADAGPQGGSDAMASQAFDALSRLGLQPRSGQSFGTSAQAGRAAVAQAQQLAQMASRGVTHVTGAGGARTELTPENIAAIAAKAQGLGGAEILAELRKIANKELRVVVKPAGGLDRPEVQAGRGAQ